MVKNGVVLGPGKRDVKIDQGIKVVDDNADVKKLILVQIKIKGENEDVNLDLIY